MRHEASSVHANTTASHLSATFLEPRPSPQIPTTPLPKVGDPQDYFTARGSQGNISDSNFDDPPASPGKIPLRQPNRRVTKHPRPNLPDIRHLGPHTPTIGSTPRLPDLEPDGIDLAVCLEQGPTPPPKDAAQSLRKTRRVKTAPVTSPADAQAERRNRSSWPNYWSTSRQRSMNRHSVPSSKSEWWHFSDSPSPPDTSRPPSLSPSPSVPIASKPSYESYTTLTLEELRERCCKIRWELYMQPLQPASPGEHETLREKWQDLRDPILFSMLEWRFDWGSGKREEVLGMIRKVDAVKNNGGDEGALKDEKTIVEKVEVGG